MNDAVMFDEENINFHFTLSKMILTLQRRRVRGWA